MRKGFRTPLSHFPFRLTDKRVAHILEQPEKNEMNAEIERLLTAPKIVCRSRSDDDVRLVYAYYPERIVDGKWLCVVVKYLEGDAFVISALRCDWL